MRVTLGKKLLIMGIALLLLLCIGCSKPIQEKLELVYDEPHQIENAKFEGRSLSWSSSDESIVVVDNASVKGIAPGTATVSAFENEKLIAQYEIEVKVIPVTGIVLSTNSCEIVEGETFQLSYTLFPANASDYGLDWKSADETVASVDESGRIKAIAPGQTTISISNTEGFIATCSTTVKKALPNFKALYGQWESETWFSVADDGSWMSWDSNPNNDDGDDWWKFYSAWTAMDSHLKAVLEELGFSSSIYEKMTTTTWSMGRQTASSETTTATWTYHPDKGLEILFEINR